MILVLNNNSEFLETMWAYLRDFLEYNITIWINVSNELFYSSLLSCSCLVVLLRFFIRRDTGLTLKQVKLQRQEVYSLKPCQNNAIYTLMANLLKERALSLEQLSLVIYSQRIAFFESGEKKKLLISEDTREKLIFSGKRIIFLASVTNPGFTSRFFFHGRYPSFLISTK